MHIQASNYPVFFGTDYYARLSQFIGEKKYSKVVLLVDENTAKYCLNTVLQWLAIDVSFEIIEIEAGEENKTIETCNAVWETLVEMNIDRKALLINVGGGMVCDLGGFVAATYKRGIDFVNIPTSLLAMVDASVGTKTGVNLGGLKNMVGSFSQPQMILIDAAFLETLPGNQMRSGLAEMYKHGLIADASYWNQLKNLSELTTEDLLLLIYHSVSIKNEIVLQDPFEKNVRKLLNFGHTLGHVIETYSHSGKGIAPLLHGEAIAVGMILEAFISYKKNLLTKKIYTEIKETLTLMFESVVFTKNDIEICCNLLIHDKKNENGNIQFTLLNEIGSGVINETVETGMIYDAFNDYLTN
ncbi:3-dehydroquinate synthase [Flavobacterium sp. CBA20B-1]|uniref:3-dehydroquinate synthase n=1 Tax=unclassified Flavobacterium TaxID=196869 RepID=UPI0022249C8F|nr:MULTISPECIES: 3-dehydroquinate synthase [unclassified Flavobacterium]WCM42272.1 3-dehydroquinate synthase [Flavobacterium sp. CBA20B-1]